MRRPPERFEWRVVTLLIFITSTCFIFQAIAEQDGSFPVAKYLYLTREGIFHGYLWQLITFQFLHGNILHLVLNMISLYFMGKIVEESYPGKEFLKLYFVSGVAGGLLHLLFALALPLRFDVPILGASAGIAGLFGAVARIHWNNRLQMMFIPMGSGFSGKALFWVGVAFSAVGMLMPRSSIAHAAHLAGLLMGCAYVHWQLQSGTGFSFPAFHRQPKELVRTASREQATWKRAKTVEPEEVPAGEFISREVDPILDKISSQGIHSLTDHERRVLEKARAKMSKR